MSASKHQEPPLVRWEDLVRNGTITEKQVAFNGTFTAVNTVYFFHQPGSPVPVRMFVIPEWLRQNYSYPNNAIIKVSMTPNRPPLKIYMGDRSMTLNTKTKEIPETIVAGEPKYDLTSAKRKVAELNEILRCNDLHLSIGYLDTLDAREIYSLNSTSIHAMTNYVYLCLLDGARDCVSSIEIVSGEEYHQYSSLYINSYTKETRQRQNLNKLLRAAAIILSKYIKPNATELKSEAINPISAYSLIKYFGARPDTEALEDAEPGDITYDQIKDLFEEDEVEYIDCIVDLTEQNIDNANRVFEETARSVPCNRNRVGGGGGGPRHSKRKTQRCRYRQTRKRTKATKKTKAKRL